MHLSELQKKEIVNIASGKRMGTIIDVIVDTDGKIKSFILEERKSKKFSSKEEIQVNFEHIVKIGDDIILIDNRERFK